MVWVFGGLYLARDTRNIGQVAEDAIRRGLNNQDALAEVLRVHPNAGTKRASIIWYRNQLRSKGEDIPTETELKQRSKKPARAAPKKVAQAVGQPTTDVHDAAVSTMRHLIQDGATNEQVHDTTMRAFPDAQLKYRTVEDLRTSMIRAGEDVPTDDEAKSAQGGPPGSAASEEALARRDEVLELLDRMEELLRK